MGRERGEERVMKVLVTAATKYGATAEIARAIGDVLAERGFDHGHPTPGGPHDRGLGRGRSRQRSLCRSLARVGQRARGPVRRCPRRPTCVALLKRSGRRSLRKIVQKMGEDPVDVAEILETTKARDHRVFAGKICAASIAGYKRLTELGYENVRRYAGGLADWEPAGYPLEGEMVAASAG